MGNYLAIRKVLSTIALILSGATIGSLIFSNSESWKYYVPIVITILSFIQYTDGKFLEDESRI